MRIKKIWNTVTTVLIGLVCALVLAVILMRVFGYSFYTVLTGSMEPEYPTGSVICVKENGDHTALSVDTPITFRLSNGTIATHRIVEVVEEDGVRRYRTKGDANEIADGTLVEADRIIGTPVFCIPWAGFALTYVQSPPGCYVMMAAIAGFLLLIFLPEILFPDEKNDKRSNIKEEKSE